MIEPCTVAVRGSITFQGVFLAASRWKPCSCRGLWAGRTVHELPLIRPGGRRRWPLQLHKEGKCCAVRDVRWRCRFEPQVVLPGNNESSDVTQGESATGKQ